MHAKATLEMIILVLVGLACLPAQGLPAGDTAATRTPIAQQSTLVSAPAILPDSSLCTDPQQALITDLEVRQIPALAEPATRRTFRDPVFGTCLARVTDRGADLSNEDDSTGMKNEYSSVQSFNADESRMIVRGISGTWYLYDARTLGPIRQIPIEVDPRWSASDPNLIYYTSGTSLMSYDIQSDEQTTVRDFSNDLPGRNLSAVWMRYEGSPSLDGRYWGLMAEDQGWLAAAYLVYDLQEDSVIASLDTRNWPEEARESDFVNMSPLGTYFLAYMDKDCEPGVLGTYDQPCGFMVYDRDLQNGRGLLRLIGHSDTALDAEGREVVVYQDIDTDHISMLDLANGEVTPLWSIDFSHTPIGLHFSGRAFLAPGWALISTHDGDPASYTWMDDQILAVELKPNGRFARLAHTQSLVDENQEHDYWAEPHGSVNRDFTRILFTSNWGLSGTGEVEMYLIQLPANWRNQIPEP